MWRSVCCYAESLTPRFAGWRWITAICSLKDVDRLFGALSVNKTLKLLRLNYNNMTPRDEADLTRVAKQAGVLEGLEARDYNALAPRGLGSLRGKVMHSYNYSKFGRSYTWHLSAQTSL